MPPPICVIFFASDEKWRGIVLLEGGCTPQQLQQLQQHTAVRTPPGVQARSIRNVDESRGSPRDDVAPVPRPRLASRERQHRPQLEVVLGRHSVSGGHLSVSFPAQPLHFL